MTREEKLKLVEKLRRAADAQRRAFQGNLYHDGIAQGLDNAAGIIGKIRCEEVPEWCTDCKEYDAEAKSCHRFSRVIRTAMEEAKPKTGRWKSDRLVSTNGGTYGVCRCSECEACYQDIGYGWNYCPNCGARMGGDA